MNSWLDWVAVALLGGIFGTSERVSRNKHDPWAAITMRPGQPALAYFELCAQDAVDVAQVVNNAATLVAAGYAVDAAWLSEVTGMKFNKGERA